MVRRGFRAGRRAVAGCADAALRALLHLRQSDRAPAIREGPVAHRFPPFESAKCHRTWAGLYEQCDLAGNPVIGVTGIGNFLAIAGFSGHGMMHAPAAGRGIAEWIVHGRYQSIDLTRLGYARVESGTPYREAGIR